MPGKDTKVDGVLRINGRRRINNLAVATRQSTSIIKL